jgi:hypothetical protein
MMLFTPCLATADAELAVAKSTQGSRSSSVVFAGACKYSENAWHVSEVMLLTAKKSPNKIQVKTASNHPSKMILSTQNV